MYNCVDVCFGYRSNLDTAPRHSDGHLNLLNCNVVFSDDVNDEGKTHKQRKHRTDCEQKAIHIEHKLTTVGGGWRR